MAAYQSVNRPSDFAFHDSDWKLLSASRGTATLVVTHLNLRADAPQNPFGCAMELAEARATLRGLRVLSYKYKDILSNEEFWLHDAVAAAKLRVDAEENLCVNSLELKREDRYALDGAGVEPFFEAEFVCESLMIEWRDYVGPAWYEQRRLPQ